MMHIGEGNGEWTKVELKRKKALIENSCEDLHSADLPSEGNLWEQGKLRT